MQWKYQESKLKNIFLILTLKEKDSVREVEKWMKNMQDLGITCILKYAENMTGQPGRQSGIFNEAESVWFSLECNSDDTLVLTDSKEISRICANKGFVCIGLDPFMEAFFDGAEAVVSAFDDLDYIYMEETFFRAKGFPVLIAETDRIRIREIVKEDIPIMCEISRQDGMEYAFADQEQAECFECERMEAYISNVYRFYGYGLWTVETLQGEVIGCCGLSDVIVMEHEAEKKETDKADKNRVLVLYRNKRAARVCLYENEVTENDLEENDLVESNLPEHDTEKIGENLLLELQYFVANKFQNQGYGTEMCRAVIKYARERLSGYEICVRIHPQNTASVRLAGKLGFRQIDFA